LFETESEHNSLEPTVSKTVDNFIYPPECNVFLTKYNITPNRNCVRTQIIDELIFDIEGNELIEEMPSVQSSI
jgi:hypothetical protein